MLSTDNEDRIFKLMTAGQFRDVLTIIDTFTDVTDIQNFAPVKAICLTQTGQYAAADALYLDLIKQSPTVLELQISFIDNLAAQGRFDEAVDLAESILDIDPNHQDAHYFLGRYAYETDQFESALAHLSVPMDNYKTHPTYNFVLAKTLNELGYDKAPDYLVLARALEPDDHTILMEGIPILLKYGEYELGDEWLQAAIQIEPENPDLLFNQGIVFIELEKFSEAISALTSAKTYDPDNIEIDLILGVALHKHGKNDAAFAQFESTAKKYPTDPTPKFFIANFRMKDGDYAAALSAINTVLQLDPDLDEGKALKEKILNFTKS